MAHGDAVTANADRVAEQVALAGGKALVQIVWALLRLSWFLGSVLARLIGLLVLGGIHWAGWAMRSPARAFGSCLVALIGMACAVPLAVSIIADVERALAWPGQELGRLHAGLRPPAALPEVLLLALALPVALLALRVLVTWRTARSRVAYVVVADEELEPSERQTEQFLASVTGMRRRAFAWLDSSASAFRTRLTTTSAGTPVLLWEVPRRHAGALRVAAGVYPGVELIPLEEYPGGRTVSRSNSFRRHVLVRELEPASEIRPLRKAPHGDVDPLAPLASVLAEVDPGRGDHLEVVVDLLPLSGSQATRWRRKQLKALGQQEPTPWGAGVAAGVGKRTVRQETWDKIGPGSPLFRCQIVIRAEASCNERSRRWLPWGPCCLGSQRASGFVGRAVSAFDTHSSPSNHVRGRLSARLPLGRQWAEARVRWGVMR